MTEKQLEQKLIKAAKARGGEAYKFTSPGHNGVPDRIVILPEGKIGFVEVKRPGVGRLTALQKNELDYLLSMGFKAYVLDDPEKIEAILNEIQAT